MKSLLCLGTVAVACWWWVYVGQSWNVVSTGGIGGHFGKVTGSINTEGPIIEIPADNGASNGLEGELDSKQLEKRIEARNKRRKP